MSFEEWSATGLQAFDAVVAHSSLRVRAGQRGMAECVAQTFSAAQLGKAEDEAAPRRAIAVIQAGTGVGKSLAYCAPAIAIALARGTRVVISTATVALQEQLVHKDLPLLAQQMPEPFRFALAKGRGRYVCKLKLERLAGQGAGDALEDDLFPDDEPAPSGQVGEARVRLYKGMADALASSAWDGDRDSLDLQPEPTLWRPVAAEASSCTGRHCPVFGECSYFEARKALVGAQVIVVNHDLLLASLGARVLPELDNCLLVLDEAHHLPATALEQFACRMDLSRLAWIDRLASRALRVGSLLEVQEIADIPAQASSLRQALQALERLVLDAYGPALRGEAGEGPARRWSPPGAPQPTRYRPPRGELAAQLDAPLAQVLAHAQELLDSLRAIAKALRTALRDSPLEARRLAALYAQIGMLAPRLEEVHASTALLLQSTAEGASAAPTAKWFTLAQSGDFLVLQAHASPVLPGNALRQQLWSTVRGAVLTSATLNTCGNFDFFLREAGLWDDAAMRTLEVTSPFNYAAQGTLVLAETRADPKNAETFTPEMVDALLEDLTRVRAGALVLFTSREQMRRAVDALATDMRPRVLVQGQLPRPQLLARHRERVAAGEPSIIFGMQSFGEGLDLPGALCESVFITKLPFSPPDDPVGEARAEWLRAVGRDPFSELVVPATALRLAQWAGRAIRSEDDQAHVYCYDRRLSRTSYGQRLLAGLPPFTQERRTAAR
ncbi:ATP-dependent DNA helicase DinG [Simplicispira suum]|uniref:ATP-dependent DNA helicase DinG n=1 Tax=Simplicispira suum TaxID=2109915 RepID=A0A2S0MZM6_9BURK|nr:ATP-dependent DNA helicase DinG [Simplicispira suum]AVO41143.1 ATP-dependent DNA helicase DinG [Simplicispira suum]